MDYSEVLARKRDRLLQGVDVSGLRGAEIGPLSRPVVSRDESEIYYIDHCSTEELIAKYSGDHAHMEGIAQVDFVWGDQSLAELLGNKAPLDYIIASHVIEHVPDLCGWLKEMSDALKTGGRLFLVIPDKRFTFDIFRRLSSFEEVIAAWSEHRRRPALRLIMDHFANVVSADAWKLWDDYNLADHLHYCHGAEFLDLARKHYAEGRYVDVHCWVFTPWHFMLLMGRMVKEMGLAFDLRHFITTQRYDLEFYVQLEKVETLTTDWNRNAEEALVGALWPAGLPATPADGLLPHRRHRLSEPTACDR